MISSSTILNIVEVVYFGPALLASAFVCVKHGFSREAGWLLLVILSSFRIIGASMGIAATADPTNTDLVVWSLIMARVGSTLVVAALTGIVNRVDSGSGRSPLPPRMRKLVQMAGIAAVVLGIIGGIKIADSDPDTRLDGYTYTKAATMLILVQYLASIAILSFSALNMRYVLAEDRTLFFCVSVAAPFVLVRVIYSICAAFNPTASIFNPRSDTVTAIAVRAVLGVAMEMIVVSLFIFGGIKAPKILKGERSEENMLTDESKLPQEHGVVGQRSHRPANQY